MRDKKFVAIHRGGELSLENHKKLMAWAEKILFIISKKLNLGTIIGIILKIICMFV